MSEERTRRLAASLMLLLHLAGCYSWQPVTASPRQFVEEEQPGHIRISQADDEELELRNPRVEGDSLAARISTYNRTGIVRIALADITAVEWRRLQVGKTVWAIVPLYLPVVLFLGRLLGSRCSDSQSRC